MKINPKIGDHFICKNKIIINVVSRNRKTFRCVIPAYGGKSYDFLYSGIIDGFYFPDREGFIIDKKISKETHPEEYL